MADAISIQELIDARTDAKTLEQAVNGDAVTTVLSRLGESYPTLANALSQIDGKLDSADAQIKQGITDLFENGGLPATPFATKALMDASSLPNGSYAIVTNDDDVNKNKLYYKVSSGNWGVSEYDNRTYIDNKLIKITGIGRISAGTSGITKVGDVYFDSYFKDFRRVVTFTSPTSATSEPIPFLNGAIYTLNNELYVYDGTTLVKTTPPEKENTLKLVSITDLSDAIANGASVGDVYYNKNSKGLFKIETITGDTGTTSAFDYGNYDIFIYSNELYVYDGTKLVSANQKTMDGYAAQLLAKGDRKLVTATPDDTISAYVNGLKFAQELENHLTELTKAGDNFAHTPAFVIDNDIVYSIFMVNKIGANETESEMEIRFQTFPLSDPANITYYDVCKIGDTKLGKSVVKNYDSVLFKKGNLIYLLWNSELAGDGFYTMLYQTFNITTLEMSSVQTTNFKVGSTTKTLSGAGINSAFSTEGVPAPVFSRHIVLMPKVSERVEGGVTYYYAAIGATGRLSMIVKTSDFVTWEYVAQPTFENTAQYEPAVWVIGDIVYYYSRQYDSSAGVLSKYDIVSKTWDSPIFIDEAQSRSEFLLYARRLYLIYAPKDRNHIGIIRINTARLEDSYVVQVANVSGIYGYPTAYEYAGKLYMLFSDNKKKIYISEFTIGSVSQSTIKTTFQTLFSL